MLYGGTCVSFECQVSHKHAEITEIQNLFFDLYAENMALQTL